jgi:orotidine-5'-phosphate decarboxylase
MSEALAKLHARMAAANSLLCVGLDSDAARLPARFAGDVPAFNRWIIEQTHRYVCAYKPNLAFYEARGAAGWRDLEATAAYLRAEHPDIFLIADAKRGDIGSTNDGYATAFFDVLGFDAITLHPYPGKEALAPFLKRADKACIILCRTSNPGAGELQDQRLGDSEAPLWRIVAERVRDNWNAHGNCMLVVGATYPAELRAARALAPNLPFLVPGVGAQGGDAAEAVQAGQDARGGGLVVNAGRAIIYADDPAAAARELCEQINAVRVRSR